MSGRERSAPCLSIAEPVADGKAALLRVVKDDAERVARAAMNAADAVAQCRAIPAARALDGTVARREDHHLALHGGDDLAARLRARPLLDEQELAPVVVDAGPAQEARELERKDHVAVEVLVQAVVPAGFVVQEERRRFRLAMLTAERFHPGERRGMTCRRAECDFPAVGDLGERRGG